MAKAKAKEQTALKSVSTMVIEEVCSLAYQIGKKRILMRSVTEEEIPAQWQLPPGSIRMELDCTDQRAEWYMEHLGEYVTLEIRRRE